MLRGKGQTSVSTKSHYGRSLVFNCVLVSRVFSSLLTSCHTLEPDVTFDRKALCMLASETGLKQQSLVFTLLDDHLSFRSVARSLTQLASLPRSLTTPPHHVTVSSSSYGYRDFPGKSDCRFDALSFLFSHSITSLFSPLFSFPRLPDSLLHTLNLSLLPLPFTLSEPPTPPLCFTLTVIFSSRLLSLPSMAAAELLIWWNI